MKEGFNNIDDLLGDFDALVDRAFIEEDKIAQSELLDVVRGASETVVSSCVLLRACRVGFGYFLALGDTGRAEVFFEKYCTMLGADVLGLGWDQILMAQAKYRLLINERKFEEAREVASQLLSDISRQIGSIEHSLKFDIRSQ